MNNTKPVRVVAPVSTPGPRQAVRLPNKKPIPKEIRVPGTKTNRVGGVIDTTLSFLLDNVAPDTSAVVFDGDSSTIRVSIVDRPAVTGIDSSGILLLGASATLTGPDGEQLQTVTTHDGSSTVIVTIEGGKPQDAGTYNLLVVLPDAAGNISRLIRSRGSCPSASSSP